MKMSVCWVSTDDEERDLDKQFLQQKKHGQNPETLPHLEVQEQIQRIPTK